jgi:hypothetical protein
MLGSNMKIYIYIYKDKKSSDKDTDLCTNIKKAV